MAIPTVQPCLSGESHAWGEWYFSEAQAGAVRRCVRCGVIMARGARSSHVPLSPDTTAMS